MALCCVKIQQLKQSRDLILQICANPCFAWWNQHRRCAPRPPAKETQKLGPQRQAHVPPCVANTSEMFPRAVKNLETQLDHSHTRCHVSLIARRSAKPEKSGCLSRSHVPTRVAYVSGSFLRIAMISSCVAHPLATRAVLSAMSTTDLPAEEIWLSTAVARTSTCHWVSGFSSTRWWTTHAPAKRQKLLLMSSDVTGWRHHSKSIAMQAPPH